MKNLKTSIDLLRYSVRLFDTCRESFSQKYSADELLKIASAMNRSEWDIYPDQWEERQIREAIDRGIAPDWEEDPALRGFKAKYGKTFGLTCLCTMDPHSGKVTLCQPHQVEEPPPKVMYIAVFKDGGVSFPYSTVNRLWQHNNYRKPLFSEMCSSSDNAILGAIVAAAVKRAKRKL